MLLLQEQAQAEQAIDPLSISVSCSAKNRNCSRLVWLLSARLDQSIDQARWLTEVKPLVKQYRQKKGCSLQAGSEV